MTLGAGAALVFGGQGDTINLGSVGQYADGGAGKMTIKVGSAGVDSVFGSSVAGGATTILGGAASLSFNPQAGGGDLINLAGTTGNATINAYKAGSVELTAVNDTIIAGNGSGSVWGGAGDRIGVGNGATVGGSHLWDHSTTISGAAVAFGTNDTVNSTTYGTTPGSAARGTVAGTSSANVTVTNFNALIDSLFYLNESAGTTASIVATSTTTGSNTTFTLPDGTVMALIGVSSITTASSSRSGVAGAGKCRIRVSPPAAPVAIAAGREFKIRRLSASIRGILLSAALARSRRRDLPHSFHHAEIGHC